MSMHWERAVRVEVIDGSGRLEEFTALLTKLEAEGREVRQTVARRMNGVWGWTIFVYERSLGHGR